MSAQRPQFRDLTANAHRDIKASLPMIAKEDNSIVDLWATILALGECRFEIRAHDNDVSAKLLCEPAVTGFAMAAQLIDHYSQQISAPLKASNARADLSVDRWINGNGFLSIITRLIERGASLQSVTGVAQRISVAAKELEEQLRALAGEHFNYIIERDLGCRFRYHSGVLNRVGCWALAPHLVGQPERGTVINRRRQALDLYGAVCLALLDPDITQLIDGGLPLSAGLAAHLSLTEAQLRTLLNARGAADVMEAGTDVRSVVDVLLLHEVPLHEWPKGPDWNSGTWRSATTGSLFRPDYLVGKAENRDAIAGLCEDLLAPIAVNRAKAANLSDHPIVRNFVQNIALPTAVSRDAQSREFLRALREAVIGPRKIRSFHEGVERWHRRAATIAAARHERRTNKPGWPALCASWHADDHSHRIVPLTSADALIAEGNALNHCVGGYYTQCRSGGTQIFSVREGDKRVATLELLLANGKGSALTITVGQFKAHHNGQPSEHLHGIVRDFLKALRDGRHPVAHGEIAAYRKQMQQEGDHIWPRDTLSLVHARQVWPFYQPMLPRPVPATFDEWVAATGLEAAFDRMIRHIADGTPALPRSNLAQSLR